MTITRNSKHCSIITLNSNSFNYTIKRHRLTDWIRKCDPFFCILQEIHLTIKGRNYIKVKGWEKVFQEGGTKKQASIAILIADKIYIKPQHQTRKHGKVHYTFTKGKKSSRKCYNSKYLHTKHSSNQFHKREIIIF